MFPSTSKLQKIIDDVKTTGQVTADFFSNESSKFASLLVGHLKEIDSAVQELVKVFTDKEREFNEICKAVDSLREEKVILEDMKAKADAKARELDERESNLLELHKVLENKRLMLEAKDNEIGERRRRSGV